MLRLSLRNILLLCGFTHFFCNSLLFLLLFLLLLLLLLLLELSRMPPWESKRAGDGWRGFGGRAQRLGAVAVAAEDATVCHSTFLLPSLLPRTCCIKYYCFPRKHLSSFLPSFTPSILPSFLHAFHPSFLHSFMPCCLTSFWIYLIFWRISASPISNLKLCSDRLKSPVSGPRSRAVPMPHFITAAAWLEPASGCVNAG